MAILDGCSQIDLLIEMPIDKLVEKAEKLLKSRRVEPLSQGTYNVETTEPIQLFKIIVEK